MTDSDDGGGLQALLSHRRLTIAGTVLVVAGLLVAFREVDFGRVVGELLAANPWLVAAAIGVYTVSWPLRGRRYGDVLSTTGHPTGTGFLTLTVFLSQTANLVLPARGGDAVRAYILKARRHVPYPTGFASLAVERGFDLVSIVVLGGAAAVWLVGGGDTATLAAVAEAGRARTALLAAGGIGAVTLVVGLLTVVVARSERQCGRRLQQLVVGHPRLQQPVAAGRSFGADIAIIARDIQAAVVIGGGSLLIWSLDVATAVLVLAALDSGLPAGPLLAVGTLAVSVGNLAKILPLSQGGVGLYEAGFTALVVALTPVGAGVALAAALIDHTLKNAVTLVGGGVAVAVLGISPSTAARRGETAPTPTAARTDGSGGETSGVDD